jgi:hypothetical protein
LEQIEINLFLYQINAFMSKKTRARKPRVLDA